ncbi:entericidin A/B family lipoprotein [Halomonas sp. NPDC076908]
MKRSLAISLLMLMTLLLVIGCNTIQGAGKDIEQGGEAVQRSADSYL